MTDIFNVAIYGSVNGKQRRIQVYGTKDELKKILSNYSSNVVLGNWSKNTVQLDFDLTPLAEVKFWANFTCYVFKLKGYVILESSKKELVVKDKRSLKGKVIYRYVKRNYLVAFDRSVTWTKNVHIMNWVGLESGNENLKKWVTMQCIKETSTLRLGTKIDKSAPKIVFCYGSQNRMIKKLLETRAIILDSLKQLCQEACRAKNDDSAKELAVVSEVK